jgi:hypothetical protein
VVLYYRGNASVAEVASTLGISETAARQRVHRGRERLKAALAAVETTLRATRPGPAFTAACIAALATRGAPAEAASVKSAAWPVAAVAGIAGIAGVVTVAHVTSATPPPADQRLATTTAAELHALAAPLRRIDERARTRLEEQIRGARIRRTASVGTASSGAQPVKVYDFAGGALDEQRTLPPPKDLTVLTKSTMRYAIQLAQPLLLECYDAAHARLPRKDGTIEVTLRLQGEPGIATIVETGQLGGELVNVAELAECLEQTLLSIELAPMPEGGAIDLHYPFTIAGRRL